MTAPTQTFADLLKTAVTDPGVLSRAYRQFHTYSLGNQLLAWAQCLEREIPPGPINTFPGWKALGRHVRKGQKAIALCMPITVKRRGSADATDTTDTTDADPDTPEVFTRFMYKPRWFVLAQTDGEALPEPDIPSWDRARALEALSIEEIPFTHTDGNCMGFARERSIAINPVNPLPHKTRFHELAHVLLGHTMEAQQADSEITPRTLRECEAESVALLCCAALDLPGVAECRGYVQSWWGQGNPIPERSAQRILKVADQILKAGTKGGE
jgi:antirestriction protein ArdC